MCSYKIASYMDYDKLRNSKCICSSLYMVIYTWIVYGCMKTQDTLFELKGKYVKGLML